VLADTARLTGHEDLAAGEEGTAFGGGAARLALAVATRRLAGPGLASTGAAVGGLAADVAVGTAAGGAGAALANAGAAIRVATATAAGQ
jgi:hypothetical protein